MADDHLNAKKAYLIFGAGGLLGKSLLSQIAKSGSVAIGATGIPWLNSSDTRQILSRHIHNFAKDFVDFQTSIIWVAGASTLRSSRDTVATDENSLRIFLEVASDCFLQGAFVDCAPRIFFASSAGGVYSKSSSPPFTEMTQASPSSYYGEAKLRMEEMVSDWATAHRTQYLIGRISSIYGENQKTHKRQGFLSVLIRNVVRKQIMDVFAPLGSVRNYVYASDAANLILRHLSDQTENTRIANICAPYNSTLASVIQTARSVSKLPVGIRFVAPPAHLTDAPDLRIASTYANFVDEECRTSLPVGVKMLLTSELERFRGPNLLA